PYHGTTTTCEALLMGVPVVTLAGRTHASRVGVSLLEQVGLSRFIASSEKEYVTIASDVASRTHVLTSLRGRLRDQLKASSLLDGAHMRAVFYAALRTAWQTA